MTNPLTGAFDVCLEVTEAVLNSFVNSTFDNTRQKFPITFQGINGTASLLINGATMTVDAHNNAVLTITFADSALTVTAPPANAEPLEGSVQATAHSSCPRRRATPRPKTWSSTSQVSQATPRSPSTRAVSKTSSRP